MVALTAGARRRCGARGRDRAPAGPGHLSAARSGAPCSGGALAAVPGRRRGDGRRNPRSGEAGGRASARGGTARRAGATSRAAVTADGAGGRRRRGSQTPAGRVRARRVVLATNAYTHHLLPRLARRFIPLYDYILVSDPLTAGPARGHRLARRQGVTDGRTFFNYYRLTATTGSCGARARRRTTPANRVDPSCDHSPAHYAALRESFRRHFPALGELGVSVRLGRADLLDDPADAVLRPRVGRPGALRAGLHRARPRHDAAGGPDPGAPGARPAERAAGSGAGAEAAVPYPAGAAPLVGGERGDARRCGGLTEGRRPGLMLRLLERMGIGFSS